MFKGAIDSSAFLIVFIPFGFLAAKTTVIIKANPIETKGHIQQETYVPTVMPNL